MKTKQKQKAEKQNRIKNGSTSLPLSGRFAFFAVSVEGALAISANTLTVSSHSSSTSSALAKTVCWPPAWMYQSLIWPL
jgi:hypothetical protein